MTQEEKQLLLADLCGRLPYGVFCSMGLDYPLPLQRLFIDKLDGILLDFYEDGKDYQVYLSEVKPYLRPMSSMTEEEFNELHELCPHSVFNANNVPGWIVGINGSDYGRIARTDEIMVFIDWLNKNMFDYRGLIEKGLAIAITKDNNPYD